AAVNGPSSTVISGTPEQVEVVLAACAAAGHRARLIEVDYASHGPQVDRLAEVIREELAGIEPRGTEVAFYSAATGARQDPTGLDARYWFASLRRTVRFAPAVDALLAAGHRVFIEASPHPVLTLALRECGEAADLAAVTVPTLRRDEGGPDRLARSLGEAFAAGLAVDWPRWFAEGPRPRRVALPGYPFQRKRYWLASGTGQRARDTAGARPVDHPLLASVVDLADGGLVLSGRLPSGAAAGRLAGHTVAGQPLVPGAVLVEWALRAADEAGAAHLGEVVLQTPLPLPGPAGAAIQLVVGPADPDGGRELRIFSAPGDRPGGAAEDWLCHAVGALEPGPPAPAAPGPDGPWPPPGAESLECSVLYERAAAGGYGFGPEFQGVRALWREGADLLAELVLPERARADGPSDGPEFGIHPVLLDAAVQPALLTDPAEGPVWLPFAWQGVTLWATGAERVRVRLSPHGSDGAGDVRELRVTVTDPAGAPVLSAESVVLRRATAELLRTAADRPAHDRPARRRAPVRPVAAAAGQRADWPGRLAAAAPAERRRLVRELVRGHAATVLGQDDPRVLRVDVPFKELGFTSLTAVELRDRLVAATGLRLPAAVVFRHPTLEALAGRLERELAAPSAPAGRDGGTAATGADPVRTALDGLESALAGTAVPDTERDAVTARLETLLAAWRTRSTAAAGAGTADRLQSASADQLLDFIDNELGTPLDVRPRPSR
ncbi:acyltransferase domain-containing protein, partial [Streptomyces palmae]|uniref:acyltransferase domain-containing protein n=1 Tax=Streptomyces palmae TaxID=1701085 RepID=UPI0035E889A6